MKRRRGVSASNTAVRIQHLRLPLLVMALYGPIVQAQSTVSPAERPSPQPGVLADTWTGRPLKAGEKFDYRLYRGFFIRGVLGSLMGGAISQAENIPTEWGGGAGAYGKRVASSLGIAASRQALAFGIEDVLHQDPRYFPSTKTGFLGRFGNVVTQAFVAKNDEGRPVPAYGRLISAFAAGQLANTWQPASNNSVGDGLIRAGIIIGVDAGVNLMTEFVPPFRKRVYKINSLHP